MARSQSASAPPVTSAPRVGGGFVPEQPVHRACMQQSSMESCRRGGHNGTKSFITLPIDRQTQQSMQEKEVN